MRSSWVCWWLLLTWALLLGQPVSGEEEGFQAGTSEGPADPVETGQPESAMEAEEPEDLLEQENLEEPDLEPELTSEERLERIASYYRDHMGDRHWESPLSYYKYLALDYMEMKKDYEDFEDGDEHERPKTPYMHLEDSSITIEKAIGNVLKFRMFLKKGECREEWMDHDDYLDYVMSRFHKPRQSRPCQKLDCIFTVFQDVRRGHDAVINSQCHPLVLLEDRFWHDLHYHPPLDDDYADLSGEDSRYSDDDAPDGPDSNLPVSNDDTLNEPHSADDDSPVY